MSPTFKEIWFANTIVWDVDVMMFHYKHSRKYYRIRSAVRIAFWTPLIAYVYYLVLASI